MADYYYFFRLALYRFFRNSAYIYIAVVLIIMIISMELTLHNATPVSNRSMKFSVLISNAGYKVFSHSAKSSRIAYKYSSLDLNGRYERASNRTVFAIFYLFACFTVNRLYRCVTDVESMYLFRLPRQLVQTTKRSNRTTLYYIHLRVVVPRPTKYRIRLYFPLSPSCVWNWNNVRHSQTQSRITKSKKILRRKKDHEKVERPKWIGF